jgi:phosphopantothenoylcysteine decarboxylase/phosphopantothenate--cysteine ligase
VTFAGRRVVLGVSGGIACYKACTIARRLTDAGAEVDVVLTASAAEFVRPVTFEALTGRPVLTSLWDSSRALAHIELARGAELVILAPATANLLARLTQGMADDLLTTILLATDAPILVAPAMNDRMYAHPATQANLAALEERALTVVGPAIGPLAEGPSEHPGRMAEPEEILAYAARALRTAGSPLAGKRVLVTAGPTREYLDPVRVLSNPSSGRMGHALAEAAFARGADVLLIDGPNALGTPVGVEVERVETTQEMQAAVARRLGEADVLLMAAAPADFRPAARSAEKVPRAAGQVTVTLEPTEDILETTVPERRTGAVVVGFALESHGGIESARRKMERKQLDVIVLNDTSDPDAGFESPTNRVAVMSRQGTREFELMPKREVAERILDEVEPLL